MTKRTVQTLARLERVRMVERQRALNGMAHAAAEENRTSELTARAEDLLRAFCIPSGTHDGGELANLHRFRQQMHEVTHSSADMAKNARLAVEHAGRTLARASARLDQTSERLNTAQRELARQSAVEHELARSLQKSKQHVRSRSKIRR